MAKILTSAAVKKYRPTAKKRAIRDGASRSLYLVVHPSGQKSWMMRFRTPTGKISKMVLGSVHAGGEITGAPVVGMPLSLSAARQLAAEVHRARALGEDVIAAHKARRQRRSDEASLSFAALTKKFVEQHARPNTRSWRESARLLGLHYNDDGGPPTEIAGGLVQRWSKGAVTERDIYDVIEEARTTAVPGIAPKQGGASESRAAALHAALSVCFGWLKSRRLIDVDPTVGVSRPRPPAARDRVLSDSEIAAFWRAASAERVEFAAPLKLLLLTGQRLCEVTEMRRSELSEDVSVWRIPAARTKNKREHVVPLSPQARELIASVAPLSTEFVFSTDGHRAVVLGSRIKNRLDQAMNAPAWRVHDLRRTAVTGMAELGIRPDVIELTINHAGGARAGVAGVYNRSELMAERRAALELWAARVAGLVSGKVVSISGRRA
jgi:integrase